MGVERPLWLDEEAEIRALLSAALDRFDRQRGVCKECHGAGYRVGHG